MSETKEIQIKCTSDKYMTFSDLIPFEDNPRELSDSGFSKLKKSILELGVFKPFLVWKQGNRIIGGNQRFTVIHHLAEQGYKVPPLPVTILDVPEGIARTIVLRDNQSDGDWAYEQLSEYFEKLKAFGIDHALTGFSDREYEDLNKLAQSSDELRKSLEKMAGEDDTKDMLTKKFGVSFKVPDGDWSFWQGVMKQIKAETGKDDVYSNIKYMMGKLYPDTAAYGGLEPAPDDEVDDFDMQPDLGPPALEEVTEPSPKKSTKLRKAKLAKEPEPEFPA